MSSKRIEQSEFVQRFRNAVGVSVAFAAGMVRHPLTDSWRFLIEPNASYDGNALVDDERLYPEDSLPAGEWLGPWTFDEAARWLWRQGQVPEWVDVSVRAVDDDHLYVHLTCCGRFTALEERLYYRDALPPFGIKSPQTPRTWKSVQASGRFDLPTTFKR